MSLRTASRLTTKANSLPHHNVRTFLTLPNTSTTQHLTALRTLPYAPSPLYDLIADVDSYSSFVPYCSRSRVTAWSNADPAHHDRSWPTLADLHVGWGGFEEVFTSRLRCVPGESVEAISGGDGEGDASAVFKSLVTRWALRPLDAAAGSEAKPRTEVHLSIKYQFANPLYAAVSSAVSDKVAGLMIEAFEKRAREKLGRSHDSL